MTDKPGNNADLHIRVLWRAVATPTHILHGRIPGWLPIQSWKAPMKSLADRTRNHTWKGNRIQNGPFLVTGNIIGTPMDGPLLPSSSDHRRATSTRFFSYFCCPKVTIVQGRNRTLSSTFNSMQTIYWTTEACGMTATDHRQNTLKSRPSRAPFKVSKTVNCSEPKHATMRSVL